MSKQVKADLMLVLVTFFWGTSYLLTDLALAEIGIFSLNAFRFGGSFVLAAICFFPKIKTVNRVTLKYSALVGLALMVVYFGSTMGVRYTSLSNAGFLSCLPVIFTPLFEFLVFRKKPSKKLFLVLLLTVTGIALLTLSDRFQLAVGDLFCLLCSVTYAIDLMLTEYAVARPEVNAFQLGVFQLGFTGAGMLVLSVIFEGPDFPRSPIVWGSVAALAIFCTGAAFIIQAIAQQYTTAAHVGVIFCLEPVFNSFLAFFVAKEVLSPQAYLGALLLTVSLLVMEMDFGLFWKKPAKKSL